MNVNKTVIGDVCDFVGGSQPPKSNFISEYKEGYIRFIQTRDYKTDSFLTYIPISIARRFCNRHDIMIGRYGPPIFQILRGIEGAYNVALMKAVPNPNIINDYLFYLLKQEAIFKYVDGLSLRTGGQTGVDIDSLNQYPILLPDLPYQQCVVDVLKSLDDKIAVNNRINSDFDAIAKTIYDYWFVQFDFPDKNGNPYKSSGGKMVWNEKLKREIPDEWKVKSLSEITSISNDSINPFDFPEKDFKHYSIPAFDESGTFKIEKGSEIKSNKFVIKFTDVLVSKLNPWFNRVIYSTEDADLISSTEFVVWRTKNIAIKNYMYMIARDASFSKYCTQSASGTSHSHKRVNPTVMMKYQIVFNDEIAEKFGLTLGSTIKMYAKNQVENNNLLALRDWLLPMLMNGQVKVK